MVQCPQCNSQKTWKDGLQNTAFGDVQRYLCRVFSYCFFESKVKFDIAGQIFESSKSSEDHSDGSTYVT